MVQFKTLVLNPGRKTQIDLQNRQKLEVAKRNIEQILQAILQDAKAELQLNLRHSCTVSPCDSIGQWTDNPEPQFAVGRSITIAQPICHDNPIR